MTKKEIMNRAWESNIFGLCLKMAWAEAKAAQIKKSIDELEELGFNRWQKGNMDRLYVNAKDLGLEVGYYNTGNVRWAEFDGSRISNCEAKRMLASKTYIDLAGDGKIHGTHDWLIEAACRISGYEAE